MWSPPEPSVGSKYRSGMTGKEIAAALRADIKEEAKNGELPYGTKATVKTEYFSGGKSIDIRLRGIDGLPLLSDAYKRWHVEMDRTHGWSSVRGGDAPEKLVPLAKRALERLEAMLKSYNYDGSDSSVDYFNTNFYGHAELASEVERAELEAARAKYDAEVADEARSRREYAEERAGTAAMNALAAEVKAEAERFKIAEYERGMADARAAEAAKLLDPEYLKGVAAAKAEAEWKAKIEAEVAAGHSIRFMLLEVD